MPVRMVQRHGMTEEQAGRLQREVEALRAEVEALRRDEDDVPRFAVTGWVTTAMAAAALLLGLAALLRHG